MNKNIIKELKDALKFVGYKRLSLITDEDYYNTYNKDEHLRHLIRNQYKLSEEFRKEFNIEVDTTKEILYFNNYQKLVEVLKDRNYYIDNDGYVYGYVNNFYCKYSGVIKLNKEYHYTKFKLIDILISSLPDQPKVEGIEFKKIKFHVSKIIQRYNFEGNPKNRRFIASSFTFI